MAAQTSSAILRQPIAGFWRFAPWLSRVALVPPTIVLAAITRRFFTDPAQAITGTTLHTPEAFTDVRVVGALTLTLFIMLITFLLATKRLWLGHVEAIALMGLALATRIFGFLHDGTTLAMGNQRRITIGEIVFLTLNVGALVLDRLRAKQAGGKL